MAKIDFQSVCKYYKGLPHQDEALDYLEKAIEPSVLTRFIGKWRKEQEGLNYANSAKFRLALRESSQLIFGNFSIYDRGGRQIFTAIATSGVRGYQSFQHLRSVAKGAIPPCTDLILDTGGFESEIRGVEGRFFPISSVRNQLGQYGRSGFGLHRDAGVDGSAGCVVIQNDSSFETVKHYLKETRAAGVPAIPLKVEYI